METLFGVESVVFFHWEVLGEKMSQHAGSAQDPRKLCHPVR